MLKRFHFFEFCERNETPAWLRSDFFLCLTTNFIISGYAKYVREVSHHFLNRHPARKIFEMGSGSGETLVSLAKTMGPDFSFIAMDIVPQQETWTNTFAGIPTISSIQKSVRIENLDEIPELSNQTIFLSAVFHHFDDATAKEFTKKCSHLNLSVLIVEPFERNLISLIFCLLGFFPTLLTPLQSSRIPFLRRCRLALLCWVVPILPIMMVYDGIISTLRTRNKAEIENLVDQLFQIETFPKSDF